MISGAVKHTWRRAVEQERDPVGWWMRHTRKSCVDYLAFVMEISNPADAVVFAARHQCSSLTEILDNDPDLFMHAMRRYLEKRRTTAAFQSILSTPTDPIHVKGRLYEAQFKAFRSLVKSSFAGLGYYRRDLWQDFLTALGPLATTSPYKEQLDKWRSPKQQQRWIAQFRRTFCITFILPSIRQVLEPEEIRRKVPLIEKQHLGPMVPQFSHFHVSVFCL